MRGLFFKVFIILWIAQSLIFVISTALIVRHHFDRPDVFFDALHSSLSNEAKESASIFEERGCDAMRAYAGAHDHAIALVDVATGTSLCATPGAQSSTMGVIPPNITGRQVGQQYVWSVPVSSATGKQYAFLLSRPHIPEKPDWSRDLLHFAFPQLPVAIVVGGVATFVLVLLVTRPVVRLRKAARELAHGNLTTRVVTPVPQLRIFEGDEIQALAHDFNHMAERLESLVSAQKLLLRDVSHELRSPLARLSVALELAREDEDPAMAAHLERIECETKNLNQLIGQLLTLSSMEAIEQVTNFEVLSLNRLIEEMIPDAAYEARQRQSSVIFRASDECSILGNQQLLHRAIENILRNAIRYTEAGSEIGVSLTTSLENESQLAILEVSDRGPGIPDDELDAIFLPFHRVDQARSPHTGGSGVGLAIAVRAVRLHGGELNAFNRPDGGATIRMRLPVIEGKPGKEHHATSEGYTTYRDAQTLQ
jgi:two-component system, OmpR family, sensor histidine kinase CpxA